MRYIYPLLLLFFSVNGFSQITDTQVILNANSYLEHSWIAVSDNIWDNESCGGKIVNTPSWVNVGNHSSLPYCWGGNSTLEEFDYFLTLGRSAGDNNTNVGYGAEPNCSVGVDCSGFVSRCYGLSTHYSTSMLNSNSLFGHHNSYNDLIDGDFINKPGAHTRMVTQVNNNGTITVIESGSGIGNVGGAGLWNVFEWTYDVSTLIGDGYYPQYYTNMSNYLGPPPNNDNCFDAIPLESNLSCTYTSGTVDNATDDLIPVPGCDDLSMTPKGVWYKFVASSSAHAINVMPNSLMNAVLVLYTGSSCGDLNEMDCNGAETGGSGNEVVLVYDSFIEGQTYWIRVYDYGNIDPDNGDFEICIMGPDPISINSHTLKDFIMVYPNPTSASVSVECDEVINITKLEVYDVYGRLIKVNEGHNLEEISISEMSPGVYLLHMIIDDQVKFVYKVVKR
jgi:hypothetical protein